MLAFNIPSLNQDIFLEVVNFNYELFKVVDDEMKMTAAAEKIFCRNHFCHKPLPCHQSICFCNI